MKNRLKNALGGKPDMELTEIVCVLDRSGSMKSMGENVVGKYNKFLREQKAEKGKATLTLVTFDDQYDIVHDGTPLDKVEDITADVVQPRGMTAMYDAIGKAINTLDSRLNGIDMEKRPGKIMVIILTDGDDNQSKEYTCDAIKEMITEKEKLGWEMMFLGANVDAFGVSTQLGVAKGMSHNFMASAVGLDSAVQNISSGTKLYRSSSRSVNYADQTTEDEEDDQPNTDNNT